MERRGPIANSSEGLHGAEFFAVLHDIFQQTQREIDDARNRNVTPHLRPPLLVDSEQPLISPVNNHDSSYRYEPLWNPALSYISDMLADNDDEQSSSNPLLSHEEFRAYQAKLAAILKEDSPSLALSVEGCSPGSSVESISPSTLSAEDFGLGASVHWPYDGSPENSLFSSNGDSEAWMNEILLTSLRGTVDNKASPSSSSFNGDLLNSKFPESEQIVPFMNFPKDGIYVDTQGVSPGQTKDTPLPMSGQVLTADKAGSQDDSGLRSDGHKLPTPEKVGKVLKPRKERSLCLKKSGNKSKPARDGDHELVNMNDLLLQCAQAIGANNTKRAIEVLNKVKQHASPYGNSAERLAYYFAEAMDARFSGTGWSLYLGIMRRRPSAAEVLRATYLYMESCPFVKAYHYFINQTILNVAKGASKVHILELQMDGVQYPSLLQALARRPGGPPKVHLVGLGFPHYSMFPSRLDVVEDQIHKTGRKLSAYAEAYGVPFEYTGWAGGKENLEMQNFVSPYRNPGEVLVVLSTSLLRYVMDETVDSPMLRSKLLKQGRDVNPDVYVQGIVTGSYSTPFFVRRFREALFHFESVFDMLDTFIDREKTDRLVFESEILGKAILNIVACEGSQVVERIDKYKHWQAVTEEVGFQQLPLNTEIMKNTEMMLKSWHKEYTVSKDSQYLLMGWKGRMLHAMSTWKATPEEK